MFCIGGGQKILHNWNQLQLSGWKLIIKTCEMESQIVDFFFGGGGGGEINGGIRCFFWVEQ